MIKDWYQKSAKLQLEGSISQLSYVSEWGMTHFVLKLSVKSLTCSEYFVEENTENQIKGNIWQTMKDTSNARLMAAI